ncbi:MAG: hypothetical protein GY945_09645 [Rhodobacteraceae bacterium]|nr:hypothetical protein [Paracoccaceae bacterium]
MTETRNDQPSGLGVFQSGGKGRGISGGEVIALIMSLIWLGGCAIFFFVLGGGTDLEGNQGLTADPLQLVMTAMAVFMPVAIIWVAAAATRSARIMREESARLQAAIDGMRHTYLQQQQGAGLGQRSANVERKLDQIAQAQRQTESAIATFTSSRPEAQSFVKVTHAPNPEPAPTSPPSLPDDNQPAFELGTRAEELAPPLQVSDFIRAMHFPENADDQEGFRALRRALQDHKVAGLVRAAQDVLTLLSQDGIYMDDMRPDMARPEFWRKFAAGERGRAIAPLGGIRDRSSLALTAGRMRKDPVFRDAAHHFLRRFDQIYSGFEHGASDSDIAAMADTRTARAFMLLGRVTGTFD